MANRGISTVGKIALALAIVAGFLSLSRAIYLYYQTGSLDIVKLVLGIGIPCLMYLLVESSAPAE